MTNLSKITAQLAALLLGLFSSIYAYSESSQETESKEIGFAGGVGIAQKNMEFRIGDATFDPSLATLQLQGTLSYGRFFAIYSNEQTIVDDEEILEGTLFQFERDDEDFTLGYAFGNGFNIFTGYKQGVLTAISTNERDGNGGVRPAAKIEFTDVGAYLGTSYTHQFSNSSLSLSVAYADLNGEIDFGASDTTGKTTGFSYSLTWNVPIADSTLFTTKVNLTRYNFDDEEMGTLDGDGRTQDLSYDQIFNIFHIGVVHYF